MEEARQKLTQGTGGVLAVMVAYWLGHEADLPKMLSAPPVTMSLTSLFFANIAIEEVTKWQKKK